MAKLRRFWHIKLVLIIVQTLQLSQAVPCLNIKCPIDGKQRVGSGLAASLKPSELLQTKAANPQEVSGVFAPVDVKRVLCKADDYSLDISHSARN